MNKILFLGIEKSNGVSLNRKILLTNQIAITICLVVVPYIFIFYAFGLKKEGIGGLGVILGYAIALSFNAKGQHLIGRIILAFWANIVVYTYSYWLGYESGIHLLFFSISILPAIIFILPKEKWFLPVSFLSLIGFVFARVFLSPNPQDLPENVLNILYPSLGLSNFIILVLVVFHLIKSNFNQETRLKASLNTQHKLRESEAELTNQLQTKNENLEEYAYAVSHDLKTPMNGISSLSEFIKVDLQNGETESIKTNLNLMQERVKRMVALIDGILSYSRAGDFEGDKSDIELKPFISRLVNDFDSENIEITTLIKSEKVFSSPIAISRILQNLISNSIKHHDDPENGKIMVEIFEKGNLLHLSVSDNGPGIDAKYREKVFRLFETLGKKTKDSTGIGLSIVKKLVDRLNGSILISENKPRGLKIEITLPTN